MPYLGLNHADSLISQCCDTARWVNIAKCMSLLRQNVQRNERAGPSDTSAGKCQRNYRLCPLQNK